MKSGVPQKYDIKTISKVVGTTVATLDIGAVPVGFKRYVSMVRANNISGATNTIYICSGTNSTSPGTTSSASAAQKFSMQLTADETGEFPKSKPDSESPLFSIAASKYVVAKTSYGNVRLFLQYYDQ